MRCNKIIIDSSRLELNLFCQHLSGGISINHRRISHHPAHLEIALLI